VLFDLPHEWWARRVRQLWLASNALGLLKPKDIPLAPQKLNAMSSQDGGYRAERLFSGGISNSCVLTQVSLFSDVFQGICMQMKPRS